MSQYTSDHRVFVHAFSRRADGDAESDEIIVGVGEAFLALPSSAVELLDWLATGKTVGEAQALYFEKHHEQPDMQDFLGSLEEVGFVQPLASDGAPPPVAPLAPAGRPVRYHFEGFPPALAHALMSWPARALYGATIVAAVLALVAEPALWPRRDALLFTVNMTPMGLVLLLYSFAMLFLHEMAHLIAARDAGVPSRLGWGHRLWMVVAETDVSQLWTLPRPRRYTTLLAGPLFDLVAASLYLCILFADARGWLGLPPLAAQLGRAFVLMHLLNLLWQCNFFLRTDFYFVLANFFACKNLMGDTEAFLRAQLARWLRRPSGRALPQIPARELRVVRWYSIIWCLGRVNMLWLVATITLPLLWDYLRHVVAILATGFAQHPFIFIDALILGTVTVTVQLAGLWMWLRSLLKPKRRTSP